MSDIEPSKSLEVISRIGEQVKFTPENITSEQAKVNAIGNLTMSAYAAASKLKLTADEMKALKADFPDSAFKRGAAGKDDLIYIEHAFLRDRLNEVFGTEWAIIPRARWGEDFEYEKIMYDKSKVMEKATRIYVEAMLVIRGCYVGEAIGDMTYYKSNAGQNYGDAVEGAKTGALRRCLKETIGVGLQAFKKDFIAAWKERNPVTGCKGKTQTQSQPAKTQSAAAPAQQPTKPAALDWRNTEVHFGKYNHTKLGDLTERTLKWFVSNFVVQTHYEQDGKPVACSQANIDQQKRFRLALNACAEEMGIDG